MTEQRRFRRIPFREALGMEADTFEEFQGTTAYDLSAGGIRVRSEQFMALGTPMRIKFQLENGEVIVLNGKVVWIQKEPYGEYYQLGVEFQDDTANVFKRKRLEDYIGGEM